MFSIGVLLLALLNISVVSAADMPGTEQDRFSGTTTLHVDIFPNDCRFLLFFRCASGPGGAFEELFETDHLGNGEFDLGNQGSAAPPAPKLKVTTPALEQPAIDYYQVSATTHDGLEIALSATHLATFKVKGWGNTKVTLIAPKANLATHLGKYYFNAVSGGANVAWNLPKWKEYAQADDCRKKAWDDMITALKAHEMGHIEIARNYAEALKAAALALGSFPNDVVATAAWKELVARLKKEHDLAQKEHDNSTHHGALTGVDIAICEMD